MENHVEKLKQMVGKCRVGMLGVRANDGIQFSPMSHVDIDDDGDVWFFTSAQSECALCIKDDPSVQLVYMHEPDHTFVSISGIARLNKNKSKIRELFNPFLRAWFPRGLEDATLTLVVVHPLNGGYWVTNPAHELTHHMFLKDESKTPGYRHRERVKNEAS